MVRLERSVHRNAQVFSLWLAQLSQMNAQLVQVQASHFLVQNLRQHVQANLKKVPNQSFWTFNMPPPPKKLIVFPISCFLLMLSEAVIWIQFLTITTHWIPNKPHNVQILNQISISKFISKNSKSMPTTKMSLSRFKKYLVRVRRVTLRKQLNLRENLVGEAGAHHKGRMPGGTTQVH